MIFQKVCSALLYSDILKSQLCSALKKVEQSGRAEQSKLCRSLRGTVLSTVPTVIFKLSVGSKLKCVYLVKLVFV
jgi:hypothetical protein